MSKLYLPKYVIIYIIIEATGSQLDKPRPILSRATELNRHIIGVRSTSTEHSLVKQIERRPSVAQAIIEQNERRPSVAQEIEKNERRPSVAQAIKSNERRPTVVRATNWPSTHQDSIRYESYGMFSYTLNVAYVNYYTKIEQCLTNIQYMYSLLYRVNTCIAYCIGSIHV